VTIISLGYFCTDADSSSAKSCGIGIGCPLPSVLSGTRTGRIGLNIDLCKNFYCARVESYCARVLFGERHVSTAVSGVSEIRRGLHPLPPFSPGDAS
jgi:hypothetical protein